MLYSLYLFPESQSAIVFCANGITDGDAADWISKLFAQALLDLEPKMDVILQAKNEATARWDDYTRLLRDWKENKGVKGKDQIEEAIDLNEYVGSYVGLGTVLTISRAESGTDGDANGKLQVAFNGVKESAQILEFYNCDTWSRFPLTRDEWLKRHMIDWDF